jgi:proton-coupled amino acid transporter
MLVSTAQYLCDRSGKLELDYGHLAKKAFDYGPGRFHVQAKKALYITNVIICIYQLGVGSVQFVFMASNLKAVLEFFDDRITISVRDYIAILTIPVILVCFLRGYRTMAYLSFAGNIFIVVGFFIVFQHIVMPPNEYKAADMWFHSFERLLLFLGAVLYAFEGQAMILPMENEMKNPRDLIRPMGVLHTGMVIVSSVFAATGFYGYLKFGDGVRQTITLNMPRTWPYQAVILLIVLATFVGFPLQNYVIVMALWRAIKRKLLPERLHPYNLLIENLFRIAIVLLEFGLAMALPNLEQIIPLIGITAGMLISFILPPLLQTVTMWDEWWQALSRPCLYALLTKNGALALFGVFAMAAGLYANILQLMGWIST